MEWDPARLSWRSPNLVNVCYVFVFLVIFRLENEYDLLKSGLEREALIPRRISRPELPSLLSLISLSFPIPYLGPIFLGIQFRGSSQISYPVKFFASNGHHQ